MYAAPSTTQVARKVHRCSFCDEAIKPGEKYLRWMTIDVKAYTNKMHPECHRFLCDISEGFSWEYTPGEGQGQRPKP